MWSVFHLSKVPLKEKLLFKKIGILLLFTFCVLTIQVYTSISYFLILLCSLIIFMFLVPNYKTVALTCSAFICGYTFFELLEAPLNLAIANLVSSESIVIIIERFLVSSYLIFLLFASIIDKKKPMYYWRIGNFKERISFPWIWKGFDHPPIWLFIVIFSLVTCILYIVYIFAANLKIEITGQLILFSVLFACINSILEEIMWRGFILSRFVETMGPVYGLIITSIGFGFYHYSLGIPLIGCIGIAFGSMYMTGLTLRSNGLLPVILFHFVLNFWMFFTGMISH